MSKKKTIRNRNARKYKTYTNEVLRMGFKEVTKGNSVEAVAHRFGINRTTLMNHVNVKG